MFDDILCINGYPEDSIDQTKHPQSHQRSPHLPMWIGHTSRFHTSPNVSTTGSLTFSEKRAYQYVLHTDHTPSGGLSRAMAQNVYASATTAPTPKQNYAF